MGTSRGTKKKPKAFSSVWVYEELESDPSFATKRMFGGLAVYYQGKMVILIIEDGEQTEYRGTDYGFALWNGLLFPTERELQTSITADFPNLISHPVLGKWLFLKMGDPDFEDTALEVVECISKSDERFGIYPKEKKKKPKTKKKLKKSKTKTKKKVAKKKRK